MTTRARSRSPRTLAAVVALLPLMLGSIPAAGSAPAATKHCGSLSFGVGRGAFAITTERVGCRVARKIARASRRHRGGDYSARGFRCRSRRVVVGAGGFRYRCRKGASRVRFVTRLGPRRRIVLEAEDGKGGCHTAYRPDASGPDKATIHLATSEALSIGFRIAESGRYHLTARYSNANFGPTELVDVHLDGRPLGQIAADDTGSWEVFVRSAALGPVDLGPGSHAVTLTVGGGDGYGWEIDAVRLDLAE